MILYDRNSSIDWLYDGLKTREEMDGDFKYPQRDAPSVLLDNGSGKVYDWRFLSVMCMQFGVDFEEGLDDYRPTYEALVNAIENQPPAPTLESVDAKAETNSAAILELADSTFATNEEMQAAILELADIVLMKEA